MLWIFKEIFRGIFKDPQHRVLPVLLSLKLIYKLKLVSIINFSINYFFAQFHQILRTFGSNLVQTISWIKTFSALLYNFKNTLRIILVSSRQMKEKQHGNRHSKKKAQFWSNLLPYLQCNVAVNRNGGPLCARDGKVAQNWLNFALKSPFACTRLVKTGEIQRVR